MSDKLIDALKEMADGGADMRWPVVSPTTVSALIAFVQAADGFADHAHNMLAQAERLPAYDAARARLLAAITGEKE